MIRYDSEELIRRYGFEKGLDLFNVLTARQLGMIPKRRAVACIKENIQFFSTREKTRAQEMN